MNIGIKVDRHDFLYDIHSLVKSFFPDDEVSIFTADDAEKCSIPRDLLLDIEIPEYTERAAAKNQLKRSIYEMLSAYTGEKLPWGTLSGIRPTKIPMKVLEEKGTREQAVELLRRDHLVSAEKAELATQIAEHERKLIEPLSLGPNSSSLYIHVPFCPSICLYCTFASSPYAAWKSRLDQYVDTVIQEMKTRSEKLFESGTDRTPTTVYVGGGTPTVLSPDQLDRLLGAAEEIWNVAGAAEYTVEAGRPDSLDAEKLAVLKAHGVSRISINPQTMNDETLKLIGRHHTCDDTRRAFYMARELGFDNINMDIILGLPGEEQAHVEKTLREIEAMGPDSLTVHSLAVKRASRLRKTIREDRENDIHADYGNYGGLVFENSQTLMQLASDSAARMGMKPYYLYRQKNMRGNLENTGFAAENCACLYNILIMEELQTIHAFGAGASTKYVFPDGRIERTVSPKDVTTYLARQQN
ncbi:MAG: coproporphyrinogen dehydrogenase HemZ [Lachnospiraceae bacterium]|nr:coproporphyrinogen dehydrogenase HemZ [Lachnospiraceae bacterium]